MRKKIFKLSFIFITFTLLPSIVIAKTLQIKTYIPYPHGVYGRLRLVPQAEIVDTNCDIGTLYINKDDKNTLYFCGIDSEGNGEWGPVGKVWEEIENKIFLRDPDINDYAVGIGTTEPASILDIVQNQNDATIFSITNLNDSTTSSTSLNLHNNQGYSGSLTAFSSSFSTPHLANRFLLTASPSSYGIFLGSGKEVPTGDEGDIRFYTAGIETDDEHMRIGYNGQVGIGTTSLLCGLNLSNDGSILAKGDFGTGPTLTTGGAGTRLLWYARKAAFRAGQVTGDQWDNPNIGWYSVALGCNTLASGVASVAIGYNSSATDDYATSIGYQMSSSGYGSTAIGYAGGGGTSEGRYSTLVSSGRLDEGNPLCIQSAKGDYSTAIGGWVLAEGTASTAIGNYTRAIGDYSVALKAKAYGIGSVGIMEGIANGDYSVAIGDQCSANGDYSTAIGSFKAIASGNYATAIGSLTEATGDESTAIGHETVAQSFRETAIGEFNQTSAGNPTAWVATDPLFVIGNGAWGVRRNIVTILKNGNIGIGTTVTNPEYPLRVNNAYVTAGGVWTPASSIEYKENISPFSFEEAIAIFDQQDPVTFNFKNMKADRKVGFISEDVPKILATKSRQSLYVMDIIATLTKVVQHQQTLLEKQEKEIAELRERVNEL